MGMLLGKTWGEGSFARPTWWRTGNSLVWMGLSKGPTSPPSKPGQTGLVHERGHLPGCDAEGGGWEGGPSSQLFGRLASWQGVSATGLSAQLFTRKPMSGSPPRSHLRPRAWPGLCFRQTEQPGRAGAHPASGSSSGGRGPRPGLPARICGSPRALAQRVPGCATRGDIRPRVGSEHGGPARTHLSLGARAHPAAPTGPRQQLPVEP